MKESFLEVLVCPDCHANFRLKSHQAVAREGGIVAGDLECQACGIAYPIIDGIPRILPAAERTDNYSRNFQFYWLKMDWRRHSLTKRRFFEMNEWEPGFLEGKYVLDAGCGGGRWVEQFAEEGARQIVALDYTQAIDRARMLCSRFDNIDYVQADLFRMPFRENLFDVVHCHGVLMATPDPRRGIQSLGRVVKPGGEIAILLYRNLTRVQEAIDRAICGLSKRLPTRVAYRLSILPTLVEYIPGAVPLFENVIHLSGQPDFTLKHLHNFDWYTCVYRHRNSPDEVSRWLDECEFKNVRVLNTNEFRVASRSPRLRAFKERLLDKGVFLKATLGLRATKAI